MKTAFISRVSNPDLSHLFLIKKARLDREALFTSNRATKLYWPSIERNSLSAIISPVQIARAWRLSQEIRRRGIDRVVFDNADPANIYIGTFLKGSNTKLTYTIHDQIPHNNNKIVALYNWLVNNFLADEVVIFSRLKMSTRARVFQFRLGGYQGERAAVRKGRPNSSTPVALFFGRVEPYKGYEYLPELARRLSAEGVKILVAGRGNSELLESARGLPGVEIVTRFISDDEASRMFNDARVSLLPYREATQSGVLLHAASFGVPSVAFAVGAIGDYMEPQIGRCVAPGDIGALAEAALYYLRMPAREWAETQRKCLEAYNAKYSEAAYVEQYRQLIAKGGK